MEASSLASQVKGFSEPRRRAIPVDLWLCVSALGLIVYSQLAYGVVGVVVMLLVSRFDYSRIREWKAGLYVFMIASILFVFMVGGATRGSKRWIDFPFFKFQPSELGKVLLILALSGFVVDRVRRLHDRDTTSRVMLA